MAIKTLLPEFAVSDKAMRRFMREMDVAAALKHPNIVEFIDRGVHNGVVYLVTEFIDGADAAKLADARGGRLPQEETLEIISQALEALSYAHARATFIATSRIRIFWSAGRGRTLTAKLTDFGLAKSFTQSGMSGVTVAGEMAGTLAYMPPEQLKNFRDVKPQSDIYALGMTAYSLLSGQLALEHRQENEHGRNDQGDIRAADHSTAPNARRICPQLFAKSSIARSSKTRPNVGSRHTPCATRCCTRVKVDFTTLPIYLENATSSCSITPQGWEIVAKSKRCFQRATPGNRSIIHAPGKGAGKCLAPLTGRVP